MSFILAILGTESLFCKNTKTEFYFSQFIQDIYSSSFLAFGKKHIQGAILLNALAAGGIVDTFLEGEARVSPMVVTGAMLFIVYLLTILVSLCKTDWNRGSRM